MSVEFQLDAQDHNKVEDFLARTSEGVSAITLHSKTARYQQAAAEAAWEANVDVLYDPRTERLEHSGYGLDGLPGYSGTPYNLDSLTKDMPARQRLVDDVLNAHPSFATIITPPHFFARDMRVARLNLTLAETARLVTDKPVRPVLIARPKVNALEFAALASEYWDAGIREIDLRFTPMGGENEGILKVRAVFQIADTFRDAGLRVILGRSGNIGQAGFAFGHVDAYSVGIGQMEHVNHATDIARLKTPPPVDQDGKRKDTPTWQGVYLPGLAATVSKKRAEELLGHSDVRGRIGCRVDDCGNSLRGPIDDHRGHYLHARAVDAARLDATPAAWRAKLETDRLQRGLELRHLINREYRADGEVMLPTRTLKSLLDGQREQQRAVA